MTDTDARIQQLQANIRQAEQEITDHLNLWSDWRDSAGNPVFTSNDSEDSPLVIELRAKIAAWQKELAPLLLAKQDAGDVELARARKKMRDGRPLKARDVMLITGLKKSKVYADFPKIGTGANFDPAFVRNWLKRSQDSAE